MNYTEKLTVLQPCFPSIVETIKKDLKIEHLGADRRFLKRYFSGKKRHKLEVDQLIPAYTTEIAEVGNEDLAEFICYRWLIKNRDVYEFFAERLASINTDFDKIERIEDKSAKDWIEGAIDSFGVERTYIFSVLNSIVFSDKIFKTLRKRVEKENLSVK